MPDPRTTIARANLNDAERSIDVTWKDGHESRYPLPHLRAECPCAQCRSERQEAKKNPFHVMQAVPSAELVNVEAVGRYGLRLAWKDGHQTGIYTFDFLREICPCPNCKAERTPDERPFVHGLHIPK